MRKKARFPRQPLKTGQALVEMALILPLLLVLIVGALELGRVYFSKIAITNAAREGVYYLTTHVGSKCPGSDCAAVITNTYQTVKEEGQHSGVDLLDANISVDAGCCEIGEATSVTVQTTVDDLLLISLLNNGFGVDAKKGSVPIHSTVEMVVQ